MAEEAPKSDVRFRPFRAAAWAGYLVVATVFSILITVSVVRSVFAMTPPRLPAAEPWPVRTCVEKARGLFDDLERHRQQLLETPTVGRADLDWNGYRTAWLERFNQAECHCRDEAMRKAYAHLEQTLDLYTTSAVQLAGEVGPTVDGLRNELAEAEKSAPPQRDGKTTE